MDFLGTPDVGMWLFLGLTFASFATSFIGVFTGTAGGLMLLDFENRLTYGCFFKLNFEICVSVTC